MTKYRFFIFAAVILGVFLSVVFDQKSLIATLSWTTAAAAESAASAACMKAPRRSCVLETAAESAKAISSGSERFLSLRAIASAQQQAGMQAAASASIAAATAALVDAHEQARADKIPFHSGMKLQAVANGQLEVGLVSEAVRTLEEMKEIASRLRGYQRSALLRMVGEGLAVAGLRAEAAEAFDQALEAMKAAEDAGLRSSEPRRTAESQLRAGMPDAAAISLRLALQASPIGYGRPANLAAIAAVQFRAGAREESERTFAEALAISEKTKPSRSMSEAIRFIIDRQVEVGTEALAVSVLDKALQEALAMAEREQNAEIMRRIGETYAKLGRMAAAAAAFERSLAAERRRGSTGAIWAVAYLQARAGLLEDALATLREAPASLREGEGSWHNADPQIARQQNQDSYDAFRVRVLCSVASAQALLGRTKDAEQNFAEAIRIARSMNYVASRAGALVIIIDARRTAGLPEITGLLVDAAEAHIESGRRARAMPRFARDFGLRGAAGRLVTLAEWLARSGAAAEAENAFARAQEFAREEPIQSRVLQAISEAYARGGRPGDALQIARDIPSPQERAAAQLSIAATLPD